MEDIIKLHSRHGSNYLKMMKKVEGEKSKTYVLKIDRGYLREGITETLHKFIDPPGGPMIVEGHVLTEAKATVKSIDYAKGIGYLVTFD